MDEEITGKAKGGHARAAKLSPEKRKEIAKNAAAVRWSSTAEKGDLLKATHEGPLKIGATIIKCANLADGTRVLTQRDVYKAMGRSGSTGGVKSKGIAQDLPRILAAANLSPFISEELRCAVAPILFKTKKGVAAYGYRAEILPEICNVYLDARAAVPKVLSTAQLKVAAQCELLVRGFARVGIIALVDEATGYQKERDRYELNKILDAYVLKEFLPWAKKFGDEFYRELFRLHGWKYDPASVKRPIILANRTVDITYDRLPVGVKDEIRRKNPKSEKTGRYKHKYFQYLTDDIGIPHLNKLYVVACALMKVSKNWKHFIDMYDRAVPKPGTTPKLFTTEEMIDI